MEVHHDFIDIAFDNKYIKPQYGGYGDMIMYFNFNLAEKNKRYIRTAYTFMEAIGEIGGVLEFCYVAVALLLTPFTHNISNILIYNQLIDKINKSSSFHNCSLHKNHSDKGPDK